jgi:hypothetical protein
MKSHPAAIISTHLTLTYLHPHAPIPCWDSLNVLMDANVNTLTDLTCRCNFFFSRWKLTYHVDVTICLNICTLYHNGTASLLPVSISISTYAHTLLYIVCSTRHRSFDDAIIIERLMYSCIILWASDLRYYLMYTYTYDFWCSQDNLYWRCSRKIFIYWLWWGIYNKCV